MDYVFSNLLGAPYRGGTLLIQDNELLTPVGNRVGQVNLVESTSKCLPYENLTQIRVLCVSPDGALLLSIDADGRALLINRKRQALLSHFSFGAPVACARFSPEGRYVAVAVGRLVQVKVFQQSSGSCFVTFAEHTAPVSALAFLPSGHALLSASLDGTVRAWDLVRYRNFRTLTAPAAVQFGSLAVDPGGEVVVAGTVDTFQPRSTAA
ncbi:Periodic tryptophan protein 2 [Tetrabaena socialis]|uniref:Periodic tryptophan protein 2 n=1 Tax=Tetrabaena socialis TaxID=47790 RepID=A0A2J7ZVA3_9CHLO|nr:Periodic tryptophan protein 2 [Tetrabaena socialis]|eukprot:PNH04192.1 Periodic tryptophan protein 2 [Tetrabaena socialis]